MISKATSDEVKRIMLKYLSPDQAWSLLLELGNVKGNQSFRDSITGLRKAMADESVRQSGAEVNDDQTL